MLNPIIDIALLLFAAKVGGILFSKIKQPSIAGELIAGVVIGPSILGLAAESALVTSVSYLGLLFLILLVSLSIDWKTLEGNTEKLTWIEIVRVFGVFCLTFLAAELFAWDIYVTLVFGFVVALSSTAIVSRSLADMKQLGSAEGQTLMGLEVVDEVLAIVAAALLANVMGGATIDPVNIITLILVVIGLFAGMSRVGFKLVNRFTSYIQKYGVQEALLGFTLLLAFLLGGLTESLGLASILGVFIAGMILSRSAQLPIITTKVKDIGESFFIPIFFASVGLTLGMQTLLGSLPLLATIIGVIVAIKVVSCVATLKLFRYPMDQALKVSSGIVTLSEMTIVIAALAKGKLSPELYASLIAAFIIVNTAAPILMNLTFKKASSVCQMQLSVSSGKKGFKIPRKWPWTRKKGKQGYSWNGS
ncbi:MAG: cation:proton antiporter [Candidatus Aenigmatarchaeota archaeon]